VKEVADKITVSNEENAIAAIIEELETLFGN
jgi:hydroxymethylpyrimidine pyrophosphatase-like HAD family hydrolase